MKAWKVAAGVALVLTLGCGAANNGEDPPPASPAPSEPRYDQEREKAGDPCTDPGTRSRTTTGRVLVCVPPSDNGRALWTEEDQ